jgi:hypothetical protein
MNPTETTELFKGLAQYGVLGLVTFLLGKRFLQMADEDRKWIRDSGDKQLILVEKTIQIADKILGKLDDK